MKLSLFNTLTKKKEVFSPIDKNLVKMYVCGPTVYDQPHIGNARSVVVYDILYRLLIKLFGKDKVIYVRNITDIDDKIIDRASKEKISINNLTQKTTACFHENMQYLRCLRPNFEPKATEHIKDMIEIIDRLISKNIAYRSNEHIYFDITKSADYAKLSGQSVDQLFGSVRKNTTEGKKNPGDFVLWKPAKNSDEDSVKFDSPFGKGRPGWHIECSAMSYKFLGENFDIHGGGADLVFPHHVNEIAQSCAAFSGSEYARIWVHNGFLTVNHEKMSKSLGNFVTVNDLIKKDINGEVARLFLLSSHYRKPLDYNIKAISDSNRTLSYWYRAIEDIETELTENDSLPLEFLDALLDDINISKAIKIINHYAKKVHSSQDVNVKQEYSLKLFTCARFIGFMNVSCETWFSSDIDNKQIEELLEQRKIAKMSKDWALADQIRNDLNNKNIIIEDKPDGSTVWKKTT
jgi:cysteinyl-tRNA synthetase